MASTKKPIPMLPEVDLPKVTLRVTRGGLPLSGYLPPTMQAVPFACRPRLRDKDFIRVNYDLRGAERSEVPRRS